MQSNSMSSHHKATCGANSALLDGPKKFIPFILTITFPIVDVLKATHFFIKNRVPVHS